MPFCGRQVRCGTLVLEKGYADFVAFGRKKFVVNPDLPLQLEKGYPLADWEGSELFGVTERGNSAFPPERSRAETYRSDTKDLLVARSGCQPQGDFVHQQLDPTRQRVTRGVDNLQVHAR